jgi:mannobiose 2-epimerase
MDLKREAEIHLKSKLIPFWQSLRDDLHGGYFGYMGYDLMVDATAPKGSILLSRILWFFSSAYRATGDPSLLLHARHACTFLDRFFDEEYGGVYWSCTFDGKPLDTAKHTYAQSFAIYGLCAYALASGEPAPLDRALELYTLIETRMADGGTYLEAFDRALRPLDNVKLSDNPKLLSKGIVAEKTMNTMLHLLEAYTLLYEATGDARVYNSLRSLLLLIEQKVYNRKQNRLEVFFDRQLNTVFDMQSFGHDIEASWLIDLAAQRVFTGEDRKRVETWTTKLAMGVYERAYLCGSLINERAEGADDTARIWWVQAEAMVGLCNLWQKTGNAQLRDAMDDLWGFITSGLVDPRPNSEWFWSLDTLGRPDRKPIVEPWKCPYHNGRMCMELISRL